MTGLRPSRLPAPGARRGALPVVQAPELCRLAEVPPSGGDWLSEIKFDGYRLIVSIDGGAVRLLTRNGLDWAGRLPHLVAAFAGLGVRRAMLDGELVALREDGVSSFSALQAALSAGADRGLHFYAFDLLYLDGWDLRRCALRERKRVLEGVADWGGMLRYSTHAEEAPSRLFARVCGMGLEGIVCKRAESAYCGGRGGQWVKVKCGQREEFVVLGWTRPKGSRAGFGSLHVGYFDPRGKLHYAGGVGSGFDAADLRRLSGLLVPLAAGEPGGLLVAGGAIESAIHWVRPELVIEVAFAGWSGAGRLRQAVFLGLREDKAAAQVVRPIADPEMERHMTKPKAGGAHVVTARAPRAGKAQVGGVEISHPDRALWPGITKADLARYWHAVAEAALPGLRQRPLAIMRCPEGIGGERFFQKNGHGYLPAQIREGHAGGQPYLAIDDEDGLIAMAQMSAIELHPWGATEADPLHPDRLVFDMDPGEGVAFDEVVRAALEVRDRLGALGLTGFCRTTGGKGLHVVAPLRPQADWEQAKAFCRAFAETMTEDSPERFVAHVKIADRKGKVLIDWLRNGLGATAVASFCPRARPGAGVATPLAWADVVPGLKPGDFTVLTVPDRVAALKRDPWAGFGEMDQGLPDFALGRKVAPAEAGGARKAGSGIVYAPKRRAARK